jgi:hypothetical protein
MKVRALQESSFRKKAIIDIDGAGTTGEGKEGMDIAYNGMWVYAPRYPADGIQTVPDTICPDTLPDCGDWPPIGLENIELQPASRTLPGNL